MKNYFIFIFRNIFLTLFLNLFVIVFLCSCSEDTDTQNDDALYNYDYLYQSFKENYANFDTKNINFENLYLQLRPKVNSSISKDSLFEVMKELVTPLHDGHVSFSGVYSNKEDFNSYFSTSSFSHNFDRSFIDSYIPTLALLKGSEGNVWVGKTTKEGKTILYLSIKRMFVANQESETIQEWTKEIEKWIAENQKADALIIDVRDNSGGNYFNSIFLAGLFVNQSKDFAITQTKNGKNKDDFSSSKIWKVEKNKINFTKPIALLTNRYTFSATEWFVLALKNENHIIQIGDTTGGGLSSKMQQILPNGWLYSLPIQRTRDINNQSYESIGFVPSIKITFSDEDYPQKRDVILEKALEEMSKE